MYHTLNYLKAATKVVDTSSVHTDTLSKVCITIHEDGSQEIAGTDGKMLACYRTSAESRPLFNESDGGAAPRGVYLLDPKHLPLLLTAAKALPTHCPRIIDGSPCKLAIGTSEVTLEDGGSYPNYRQAITGQNVVTGAVSHLTALSASYLSMVGALAYPCKTTRDHNHGLRMVTGTRGVHFSTFQADGDNGVHVHILVMPIYIDTTTSVEDMGVNVIKEKAWAAAS